MLFGFLVVIFVLLIVDLFVRIDWISGHWSWKIYSGVITNCMWDVSKPDIHIFYPRGLWKVMAIVPIGCSEFFVLIDFFNWYKIFFKLFVKAFFCWLLTCVYRIYWISVYWCWNLSLGVIANCQWDHSKPDIHICFLRRRVEGCGKGAGFFFSHHHQYIDWL